MEQSDVYGEEELSPRPRTVAMSRAVHSVPSDEFPYMKEIKKGDRVWSAPLLSRDRLVETLNTLEKEEYTIFEILTISASMVQIICFQEKNTDA